MPTAATSLTTISALAVFAVLMLGLWNMGRPGNGPNLSQKLMRWRVALQFVTIAIAMTALYLTR